METELTTATAGTLDIKTYRERLFQTQQSIADLCGVRQGTIATLERGMMPRPDKLKKILKVYQLDYDTFIVAVAEARRLRGVPRKRDQK